MNTETQTGTGYKGGEFDNVISFAGYIARHGRKTSYKYAGEETNLICLAGCDVIDIEKRRG